MKMLNFSSRTAKEILRDPVNLGFGLGFPVVLILLLSAIQANIPVSVFQIDSLAPGMTVFGLSFMTLFAATLIAKDRESALLQRLYTTPLTAADFIFGYTLPLLPIALCQAAVCFVTAFFLGLEVTVNVLWSVLMIIPASVFFIALGLLCGSVLSVEQVGGICGALLTNLTAWLSGIWFDLELVGGAFKKAAELLPFCHAVRVEQAAYAGSFADVWPDLAWVIAYAAAAVNFRGPGLPAPNEAPVIRSMPKRTIPPAPPEGLFYMNLRSFFRAYADRKAHAEGGEDGGCESEGVDIAVDKRGNYAHGTQSGADGGKLKCSRGLLFAQ